MDLSVSNSTHTKSSMIPNANASPLPKVSEHKVEESFSEDDDMMSTTSLVSGQISDADPQVPVRVRDMIRMYDKKNKKTTKVTPTESLPETEAESTKSQHTLASVKSSFCGLNRFGSQSNVKQYVSQLEEQASGENASKLETKSLGRGSNRRNKEDDMWIKEDAEKVTLQDVPDYNLQQNAKQSTDMYHCDHTKRTSEEMESIHVVPNDEAQKNLFDSTEILDDTDPTKTVRHTYESKTTISKTYTGVRIVIDIYFNPDDEMDESNVIGSRIETAIPGSTILAEFQEKAIQLPSADKESAGN